jgi:hypothetical protein
MKIGIIFTILISTIVFTSCQTYNESIVCNDPYIGFETGCCLDQNDNNICDNDEEALSSDMSSCTLPSGIACLDFRYTGTAIELTIQNGAGFDMIGVNVGINGPGCNAVDSTTAPTLTNGQSATYSVACSPYSGKFKGEVTFDYTNQETGMTHAKVGEVIIEIP